MVERLWFASVIEGLYGNALKKRWTPKLLTGLRELGIDLEKPLLPAYPAETFVAALKYTARELYPQEPLEEALYTLGGESWRGFRETLVGKAMVALLRVLGPRRTLPRSRHNFRSGTNYIDVVVTERRPNCFLVHFNDVDDIPHFFCGLMDSSGLDLGAPRKTAHVLARGKELTLFIDLSATPSADMEALWQEEKRSGVPIETQGALRSIR
jgi:uncharacterized protein (TIGR02265 family)